MRPDASAARNQRWARHLSPLRLTGDHPHRVLPFSDCPGSSYYRACHTDFRNVRAYTPTMELRGKRVLITGASRGIGESFARAFAGAGATVALVARTEDAIRALGAELGGTVHPADLSDPKQVDALISHVEDEAGPIDVSGE